MRETKRGWMGEEWGKRGGVRGGEKSTAPYLDLNSPVLRISCNKSNALEKQKSNN